MYEIPETSLTIPAQEVELRTTRDARAWAGGYVTVELTGSVEAVRAHVGAGTGATARDLGSSAGTLGRWYAIGDVVHTRRGFASVHSLPSSRTTKLTFFRMLPGTVLNVGRCSPLFGGEGGGVQAEWLDGPMPSAWMTTTAPLDRFGHA